MARKLKTYVTSLGFFEQAIAAPSMKAALEAWGSGKNLFHQGFAEESDDPAIVAATTAKPGVVLKRPVGSRGAFTENAELPKSLPAGKSPPRPAPKPKRKAKEKKAKAGKGKPAEVISLADAKAAREAAALFEKEQARREREEAKEEAARQKKRAERDEAVARVEAALDEARKRHDETKAGIEEERDRLDRRGDAEDARWEKEKKRLDAELRRASE